MPQRGPLLVVSSLLVWRVSQKWTRSWRQSSSTQRSSEQSTAPGGAGELEAQGLRAKRVGREGAEVLEARCLRAKRLYRRSGVEELEAWSLGAGRLDTKVASG